MWSTTEHKTAKLDGHPGLAPPQSVAPTSRGPDYQRWPTPLDIQVDHG